jgi:hypothetical protein
MYLPCKELGDANGKYSFNPSTLIESRAGHTKNILL